MYRYFGAVLAIWTLLAPMPGSAQPARHVHADPICGLRVEYPADWTEWSQIHRHAAKPAAGFTDSIDTPGIPWQSVGVFNNTAYDVLLGVNGTPVAGGQGTTRVGPKRAVIIPLGGASRVAWTVGNAPTGAPPDTPSLDVFVETRTMRVADAPLTPDLIPEAEDAHWRIFFDSPEELGTRVQIDGVWDTGAIGSYLGSSGDTSGEVDAEPAVSGTLIELLLSRKLPGSLVWIDSFREGPMAISYLIQSQRVEDRPFYHLSSLLITTGATRGVRPNGWSYSVVGAWIPQAQYQRAQPLVMDIIVRSITFTKPAYQCR